MVKFDYLALRTSTMLAPTVSATAGLQVSSASNAFTSIDSNASSDAVSSSTIGSALLDEALPSDTTAPTDNR